MSEFQAFPKLSRLHRPVIVTEKIDGTNAQILVSTTEIPNALCTIADVVDEGPTWWIAAGSRNRWLSLREDNYGFARWVEENSEELCTKLGEGRHFGEWWGRGIQRGYSLSGKKFSLFNTAKWSDDTLRPTCCSVVPVLAELPSLDIYAIQRVMKQLMKDGSKAAPGFMEPEGVVAYHAHGGHLFKMTPEDKAKGTAHGEAS